MLRQLTTRVRCPSLNYILKEVDCYFHIWMPDPRTTSPRALINTRRSQRVVARIRVQVRRPTDGDGFMSEVSHTLVVNAHGALIRLVMKVQASELLAIKHLGSGEEKHSRVVGVGAEAASQNAVAIEFIEPAPRFWHIDFPPTDWKLLED